MDTFRDQAPCYRSFLLRCWEVRGQQPGSPSTWRFGLEDPETGERHSFAGLEALVAFLQAKLARLGDQPEGDP